MNRNPTVFLTSVVLLVTTTLSPAGALDLPGEWRREFTELERQMADRSWSDRVAGQVAHPAALIAPGDRDPLDVVLRRSRVLLEFLRQRAGAAGFADESTALDRMAAEADGINVTDKPARYACYERACRLRRGIAFRNPLLDFNRLLFLTKQPPQRGDHHMVDQYYGFNARPGGSIHVLEGPFGDSPQARDLMAGVTIAGERLAGRALSGGVFNTLDLDFDGETLAFAWCECGEVPADADWSGQPWPKQRATEWKKPFYFWAPATCYHVFRFRLGETQAAQLTDGPWQDFDPCFLPNGRIAFVSERRGGFLRCGGNRPNPAYTLHAMMRDGTDIIPLSYHETNEWNPSVTHDGLIAYTRWDYVDRDNDIAHHLWLCFPDGRDPRSFHGNYPLVRESRPWMEMSIRAVPGSSRYVAVAAPHHGYNFGSLVLIDQSHGDDGAMGQLRRLTPEAHFPESESAPGIPHSQGTHQPDGEAYATPWPLSEEFHLCSYDSSHRQHGIYLIDSFGNRELVWREPGIACLDPMPLRPRLRPPALPPGTRQATADRTADDPAQATVAIANIYDSDFAWPAATRITSVRVIQLFPKSTYHMDEPMVGAGIEALVRGVVGTAPVEADGSAHFDAPAGVPLYFQAVDEHGRAVQSMRSDTYLHRGERLTCVGCHEPKDRGPTNRAAMPLAWQRAPSPLVPPPDGAYPVSFPRLVQPVLDRRCVQCHEETRDKGAKSLAGKITGPHGWTGSFVNLRPYAWAWNGGNGTCAKEGPRSPVGRIGARASRLLGILERPHYGLELDPAELQRIVIWLDTNSNFYGDYLNLEAQATGEKVMPVLR